MERYDIFAAYERALLQERQLRYKKHEAKIAHAASVRLLEYWQRCTQDNAITLQQDNET